MGTLVSRRYEAEPQLLALGRPPIFVLKNTHAVASGGNLLSREPTE